MGDPPAMTSLDPDQVACPTCHAAAGVPCHTPTGAKSRTIHVARRRLAANPDHDRPTTEQRKTPRAKARPGQKPPPATRASRAKGGRKASQDRKRRRAEQAAAIEAETERKLREEAHANAVRLAEDAVRFEKDRAILKRQTLDAAGAAATRLVEALAGLQIVKLDDEGRPLTRPVETTDRDGRPRITHVPDVRGAYSASTVERLAKVAASTLNSLRLEEGKPTAHTRNSGDDDPALERASVEELIEWASANLPRDVP